MSDRPGHVVRIERSFAASAEDVFDAWTSPEVMRRWFHCAAHWETPAAEVDLRVGGKVRVVMRKPDGRSEEHTSELQSRSDLVCRLLLEKKKKRALSRDHLEVCS